MSRSAFAPSAHAHAPSPLAWPCARPPYAQSRLSLRDAPLPLRPRAAGVLLAYAHAQQPSPQPWLPWLPRAPCAVLP
eukprot:scaffold322141_cov30-Tisochrysis_lutea.AAC.1